VSQEIDTTRERDEAILDRLLEALSRSEGVPERLLDELTDEDEPRVCREYLETMGLLAYDNEPMPLAPEVEQRLMGSLGSVGATVASFRQPSSAPQGLRGPRAGTTGPCPWRLAWSLRSSDSPAGSTCNSRDSERVSIGLPVSSSRPINSRPSWPSTRGGWRASTPDWLWSPLQVSRSALSSRLAIRPLPIREGCSLWPQTDKTGI